MPDGARESQKKNTGVPKTNAMVLSQAVLYIVNGQEIVWFDGKRLQPCPQGSRPPAKA